MAWTPLRSAGAEMQHVGETNEYVSSSYGGGSMTISSTKAKTGTYSFRSGNNDYPRGYGGVLTQFRAGVFINHNGVSGTSAGRKSYLWVVPTTGIANVEVYWTHDTSLLTLAVNGSAVDTIDVGAAGFSTTDTWYHLGLTYKADASAGFSSVYLNGTKILDFTGATGTQADGCYFGGRSASINGWVNYAYFDDFYIDSSDGSEADAAPNSYNIPFMLVNGAGDGTPGWTATGASPQYACVDETGAPNDNTDYVLAGAADLIDYYALTDYTIPSGRVVVGAYPTYWALKSDAGIATTITPGLRLSGTDADGSALTPSTTYGIVQGLVGRPGGGTFSQSDINALQLKLKSSGAFS